MLKNLENGDGRLAVVFGGSGFVGRHIVRELARRGWRIRAASRRPDLAGHLQPMGNVGQIHAVQANLRYPESLAAVMQGADAVVVAVGVLARSGRQTFQALHADGPRAIAAAARDAGVEQLVHISALGADTKSRSDYARSKAAGETGVLEEFPGAIIIRPSIVFGPEDSFFNRFGEMASLSPVLPLVGGGATKFQPVYAADLALGVVNALSGAGEPGTIYEAGGPEVLSFKKLLQRTIEWTGRRRMFLPMSFWLAKLQAILTWPLPNAVRPLTYDQVRLLQQDNIVSEDAVEEGRTLADLGVANPSASASVVPTYLERFKPTGQFAHYRG